MRRKDFIIMLVQRDFFYIYLFLWLAELYTHFYFVLNYGPSEDRCLDGITINNNLIDSMLLFCSVIDDRRRALCATFCFLPPFAIICGLLLNRHMATWNLFLKLMKEYRDWWIRFWIQGCGLALPSGPWRITFIHGLLRSFTFFI